MTEPRIILLNDPTRGIDVGTKQELYRLMRELADQGAAILFYSTDYDELIGCCDRVAIMYDGRIVRELEGAELTETNIIASALNIDAAPARAAVPSSRGRSCLTISPSGCARISASSPPLVLFCVYLSPLQICPSEGLLLRRAGAERRRDLRARHAGDGADRAGAGGGA